MKIIVTGNQGYLGSVITPALQRRGHEVLGLDTGLFADQLFGRPPVVPTMRQDIRDVPVEAFRGVAVVVHLAALSNDPLGSFDDGWTREINLEATVRLAELAKSAGVRRFVFASSCIMYGGATGAIVDESAKLDPRTEYACSKVAAERELASLADETFSPVLLRNGTVYGASPRLRLDTVFNDFLASAVLTSTVVVRGDGQEWRPVVDIRDVAHAFVAAVEAPTASVHNVAFNTGADHLNRKIVELASTAASLVDGASVTLLGRPGSDKRSYRGDFGRFRCVFPQVRFRSVEEGGRDMVRALRDTLREHGAIDRERFVRLSHLRQLVKSGQVDGSLRWTTSATGPGA
jgi:nucleoside-diphosphate-sugar epimerase